MRSAAAKGRKLILLAAVCLAASLLLAPSAEATRGLPVSLSPSLEPPVLIPPAATAEPSFGLLTDEDRFLFTALSNLEEDQLAHVLEGRRFRPLSGVFNRDLASRLSTYPTRHISLGIRDLWWKSHQGDYFLEPDPLGPVDSPNLYQAFGFDGLNLTDPYGLGLRWTDWFGIVGDAAWSSVNPMNYSENLQREIGGVVGFGKFVGGTIVGAGALAVDAALVTGPVQDLGATERMVERGEALANVVAHPINTVAESWNSMAANVEEHEAAGEYFSAGVEAGEWGSAAGAVVVGGVEATAAIARVARTAVSMEGIAAGVTEGLKAAGREMAPAPVARAAPGRGATSPILSTQRELSIAVNRQGAVVDRWLRTSQNRWASLYRATENTSPNFAKGIRGRFLDRRMNSAFQDRFGDIAGVRIDQTISGSGNALRPDLYLPNLGGKRVIFEVGSPSKVRGLGKYKGMADYVIPIIPKQWF